jgi:hypothetical protein
MTQEDFIQKLYEFIDSDKALTMGRHGGGHGGMKYDFVFIFQNWLNKGENTWDEFSRIDSMCDLIEPTIKDSNNLDNYTIEFLKDIIPTFEKLKQGQYFVPFKSLIESERHNLKESDVTKFLELVAQYINQNPKGKRRNGSTIKVIRANYQ